MTHSAKSTSLGSRDRAGRTAPIHNVYPGNIPAIVRTGAWSPWVYANPKEPGGKPAKRPICGHPDLLGVYISINDVAKWGTFEEAVAALDKLRPRIVGLGRLAYAGTELLTFLDLDNCINEDGDLSEPAAEVVKRAGTYTEISPSGRGLRLVLKGMKPGKLAMSQAGVLPDGTGCELYDNTNSRFLTFTGRMWPGTKGTVRSWTKGLQEWLETHWRRGSRSTSSQMQRITTTGELAELMAAYENPPEQIPTIEIDWRRFLTAKGKPDRSRAFMSAFMSAYRDPEVSKGEALVAALVAVYSRHDVKDLDDKRNRVVVMEDTGEVAKVPFPIWDAIGHIRLLEAEGECKLALKEALTAVEPADRVAVAEAFLQEYPAFAWHVAYAALSHSVDPEAVQELVGDDVFEKVTGWMDRKRGVDA